MKRWITVSVAILLLISGCSAASQSQVQTTPAEPTCTSTQTREGRAWIEGQLKAFGDSDLESAYTFASQSFQARSSFEQFSLIIVSNYGFLLELGSYEVVSCSKRGEFFLFAVEVIDKQGEKYPMEYMLSRQGATWGVDAALVTMSDGQPSYL